MDFLSSIRAGYSLRLVAGSSQSVSLGVRFMSRTDPDTGSVPLFIIQANSGAAGKHGCCPVFDGIHFRGYQRDIHRQSC